MPIVNFPDSDFSYYLIAFDANGRERNDDPDGVMTQRVIQALREESITDVFIVSHGWKGDVPAARDQYDRWIGAMRACPADLKQIRQNRGNFKQLVVGFHWPSLPFGDEELGAPSTTFGTSSTPAKSLDALVKLYADRLVETPEVHEVLQVIIGAALQGDTPPKLPEEIRTAYLKLDEIVGLGAAGVAAAPGSDREPFDPDRAYRARGALVRRTFGAAGIGDGLLAPLRQLSFWSMKDRGRRIGETAGAHLLRRLQDAGESNSHPRFHLTGHSFGCVVVSAMLQGSDATDGSPAPVHSLSLIQGALSLWSYAAEVPGSDNQPGFFRKLIIDGKVRGAMITTQSRYDTAVGKLYPVAAGVAGQVTYAPGELPKYGALGAFGARGEGVDCVNQSLQPVEKPYGFSSGKVYNLDASAYVCEGGGLSGAHSDIARPEVAHAVWAAAMSTP